MFVRVIITALMCFVPLSVKAKVVVSPSLAEKLGPEATEYIKSLPSLLTLYQVNGTQRYEGNFLVADEIVFGKGAKLILSDVNSSLIVIAANKIKFTDPSVVVTIERETPPSGTTGEIGAQGAHGSGWGGHGSPGGTGQNGGDGLNQPVLLFFTAKFESPTGAPFNGTLPLQISLPASPGGPGGPGGTGGNGAKGDPASGDHRHFPKGCRGGRDGGAGGNGGPGGRGGDGGKGSDGVAVALIAPASAAELFSYAEILNPGATGGPRGAGGAPGGGGEGGDSETSSFPCNSRPAGPRGQPANPPNLGVGAEGIPGQPG